MPDWLSITSCSVQTRHERGADGRTGLSPEHRHDDGSEDGSSPDL